MEGYSNPRYKKAFDKNEEYLRKSQRIGGKHQRGTRFSTKQKQADVHYRKLVTILAIALGLLCLVVFFRKDDLKIETSKAASKITQLQFVETSDINPVSKIESYLLMGMNCLQREDFKHAYLAYKKAYQLDKSDEKVLLGLLTSSKELCRTKGKQCNDVAIWRLRIDQLE